MSGASVFISYAREDEDRARQVYFELKAAGLYPWFDKMELTPGLVWEVAIPKAIKSCDIFLALLSSTSLDKSGYVQREIQIGLSVIDEIPPGQTFVIPARLDDCHPTDPRLVRPTWADLFPSLSDGIKSVIAAVRNHTTPAPSTADLRLMMLRVRLEEFWREGGTGIFNSFMHGRRISELLSNARTDDESARELHLRVARCFESMSAGEYKLPPVSLAYFVNDDQIVVAEYYNGVNLFWEEATGNLLQIGGLPFLTNRFESPDGQSLLVPIGNDAMVNGPGSQPCRLVGHTGPVRTCAFFDDGSRVVTGSQDGTARIWDTMTGETLAVLKGHPGWVTAVAVSRDGSCVLTGAEDQRIRRWDARTGGFVQLLRGNPRPTGNGITDIAFSPSGRQLVAVDAGGAASLWDCDYWGKVADMQLRDQRIMSARFSQAGDKVVTATIEGLVVVWPIFSRLEALAEAAGASAES